MIWEIPDEMKIKRFAKANLITSALFLVASYTLMDRGVTFISMLVLTLLVWIGIALRPVLEFRNLSPEFFGIAVAFLCLLLSMLLSIFIPF